MSRKTGAFVLVALAISVAFVGLLLALRCRGESPPCTPTSVPLETLTIESR